MLAPLGIAFIASLVASTIVALTLTPVLSSYLLGKEKAKNGKVDGEPLIVRFLKKYYEKALRWTLQNKKMVLGGTGVLLVITLIMFFTLGRSFLPPFNEGSFTINVSTLPGISLEESDKIGRMAEEILLSIPDRKKSGTKLTMIMNVELRIGSRTSFEA